MNDPAVSEPAIRMLHARYTDAVFRKDIEAFGNCFCSTGEWRISGRVLRGRAEITGAIDGILSQLTRVLISFRSPIVAWDGTTLVARTYVDEQCAWQNGATNMNLGRYYDRFAEEDGELRFSWRLFQLLYRGPADLTGTFYDNPDYCAPPGMPPLDAETPDISAPS